MHGTRTHAVYDVLTFHITHEIRLPFYAVRLVKCRFGSIFYVEIESDMKRHCRSPPLEIFETD